MSTEENVINTHAEGASIPQESVNICIACAGYGESTDQQLTPSGENRILPKLVASLCPYCAVGCRFYLKVERDRAEGIEYMKVHSVTEGGHYPKRSSQAISLG